MKKIKLNCAATVEETFADFLTSRKAKGLADKTLQSYEQQFRAVARHLDVKTDIAMLQKADLDAMIVSMREAGLSFRLPGCVFGLIDDSFHAGGGAFLQQHQQLHTHPQILFLMVQRARDYPP